MPDIVDWENIKGDFVGGGLLLGNGSSVAVSSNFAYESLFEEAKRLGYLTKVIQDVFDKFDIDDFELVLRRLWQAKLVNEALGIARGPIEEAYEEVRNSLISTIRDIHVSHEDAKPHLEFIYKFMSQFEMVISLNYDLIVYWASLLGNGVLGNWFKDCFNGGDFRHDWSELVSPYKADGTSLFFYPHGNLVLLREGFSNEEKVHADRDDNLLDTILNKWADDSRVPLFVCEGVSENKLDAISSSNYLERVYFEIIPSLDNTLVIYGWGFGDQDEHLLRQLRKSKVSKVAVSVHDNDQAFVGSVEKKLNDIGITNIVFFGSQSNGCWNNPDIDEC